MDHKKWLNEAAKQFKAKIPTTAVSAGAVGGKSGGGKSAGSGQGGGSVSARKKNALERRKQELGTDGAYRLKKLETPTPELIEDPDAPLAQFLLEEYKILVNKSHPLFDHRKSKCVKRIEDCVVEDEIENYMFLFICRDILYKIWEVHTVFGKTKTTLEKKQMWSPEVLSGCWSTASDLELLRKARKVNSDSLPFSEGKLKVA